MRYSVILKPSAVKQLDKLPMKARLRVIAALEALERNPRPVGCLKLEGEADLYRIRVGDFRVVYTIEDQRLQVLVVRVANRKDAYR